MPYELLDLTDDLRDAAQVSPPGALTVDVAGTTVGRDAQAVPMPWRTLANAEGDYIRQALAHTGGRIYGPEGAAKLLGLKPSTLQSRMSKLGIPRRQ